LLGLVGKLLLLGLIHGIICLLLFEALSYAALSPTLPHAFHPAGPNTNSSQFYITN
jgi:hypothetical protein